MNHRSERTCLAFDFGSKKIGVAVGQEVTCSARPLRTIAYRARQPDWSAIAKMIEEWRPDALVVGLPYHMDGREHELTRAARNFGHRLEDRFSLPVHFADERLTSEAAAGQRAHMRAQGVRHSDATARLDPLAAQIILEDWLRQQDACRGT